MKLFQKILKDHWESELFNDRNEIVFEQRNKTYGAYVLRKDYNRNMLAALFVGLVLMTLCLVPVFIHFGHVVSEKIIPQTKTIITEIITPPIIEPDIKKQQIQKANPQSNNIQHQVVQVTKTPDAPLTPVTENNNTNNTNNVNTNTTNNNTTTVETNNNTTVQTNTQTTVVTEKNTEKKTEVFSWVPIMPSFPGGEDALKKYLSKNMHYPRIAVENQIEGKVMVSFVVWKDGSISDIKILRGGLGGGIDEEALRVVKSMPKWNPGKQNGEAVPVSYTLPITFQLQ